MHKTRHQIDHLIENIHEVVNRKERVLITTLTKRMSEDLTDYLKNIGIRCEYMHSEIDTIDRVKILRGLRLGKFDVLVGINLLREGLDLPEVSLVAILDADKEGFLRSERALVQTVGRAARNINGRVIMYADKMTNSMQKTIDETDRRRAIQEKYNTENGITPTQIYKTKENVLVGNKNVDKDNVIYEVNNKLSITEDPVIKKMNRDELESSIKRVKDQMKREAKKENFIEAAHLRDELFSLKKILLDKFN